MSEKTIRNYPIFETGRWNNMSFTDEDLDDIVRNYNELRSLGAQQVPLKLGHNEDQPVTDGKPALGWVENLRRVGTQIIADFVDVPRVLLEAIKQKLYRAVSVEFLLGVKYRGKKYKHVLDAVAILGADQPAVHTLPDLRAYLASRDLAFDEVGRRLAFEAIVSAGEENPGKNRDDDKLIRESLERAVMEQVVASGVRREMLR